MTAPVIALVSSVDRRSVRASEIQAADPPAVTDTAGVSLSDGGAARPGADAGPRAVRIIIRVILALPVACHAGVTVSLAVTQSDAAIIASKSPAGALSHSI